MKVHVKGEMDEKTAGILGRLIEDIGGAEELPVTYYSKVPFLREDGKRGEVTVSKQHGIMVKLEFFPYEEEKEGDDEFPGFGCVSLNEDERITEEEIRKIRNLARDIEK